MSSQAPPSSQYTGKRKRASSAGHSPLRSSSNLPDNIINPYSYPPDKLYQLSVAGAAPDEEDPTADIKDFPHRPLNQGEEEPPDDEDKDSGVVAQKKKGEPRAWSAHKIHLDVLVHAIQQFLSHGDVEKAARSYGLALQLRPRLQEPLDVRRYNLWALGAEIIMREGEQPGDHVHSQHVEREEGFSIPRRWGNAANIKKLRAYFDTLIQQYPYDYRFPDKVSAVDFHIALFSCEVYSAHAEHTAACERLDTGNDTLVDEEQEDGGVPARREEIRRLALAVMTDVTRRMDEVMREAPYNQKPEYLRLRAVVSLYIADLVVPTDEPKASTRQVERRRESELDTARDALRTIIKNGGKVDTRMQKLLDGDEVDSEDDDGSVAGQLYASLPIREM